MVPIAFWWPYLEKLNPKNMIVLNMENGRLVREKESIEIEGKKYNLKTKSKRLIKYGKKELYKYLIEAPLGNEFEL